MRTINYPTKKERDDTFYELESKGIKVEAWLVKNADFEYKECSSGRYLAGKNIYQLKIYEEGEEYDDFD